MTEAIIASILAITYGLVEAIKWFAKGSVKGREKEEYLEHITLMLEKIRNLEHSLSEKERKIDESLRILDRLEMTNRLIGDSVKDLIKSSKRATRRKKD